VFDRQTALCVIGVGGHAIGIRWWPYNVTLDINASHPRIQVMFPRCHFRLGIPLHYSVAEVSWRGGAVDHAVCGDISRSNCTGPAPNDTFQVVARASTVIVQSACGLSGYRTAFIAT